VTPPLSLLIPDGDSANTDNEEGAT
jgi:hypothetical protein